jgi:gamma-glutamyltranspeptidase / glutathione hydrolase
VTTNIWILCLSRRLPIALPLVLALAILGEAHAGDRVTGRDFATRSEVLARHGMAATSQPLASQAALEILRAGGNAVDAAIAANAVLGLVEPTGSGMGGDLFAIVWSPKSQRLHGLNASGRSPESLTREWFIENGYEKIPSHGPLPVSVPGCVDGWFTLHQRFGRLPMDEILAPAIRLAREGFPVTELIAYYWGRSAPFLSKYPGFEEQMTIDGRGPRKGEIWKNLNLAHTLEALANEGRDVFYEGEIAHTIADFMQSNGGFLSYADMSGHFSEWVEPVSTNYRGVDVWELPPNGQGIAALQILNILEPYDFSQIAFGSPEHVHLFVEAKKLAFEDRAKFYGDPAFCDVPLEALISKEYATQRRELLNEERAARRLEAGNPGLEDGDTIYLSTADEEGWMVSLIQSNYRGMGSGMTPPGLGFVLQDRGELFSLEADQCNSYEPGKRPFHTIIPAFLTRDGKPWVSFGVMGGAMQPQGHAEIVMNLVDFSMNLQEAGDAPRIRHEGSSQPTGEVMERGGIVTLESGFPYETVRGLMMKGHRVQFSHGPYGGYQAIMLDTSNGVLIGASESRKDGHAEGY